jgi:hypothetical protein
MNSVEAQATNEPAMRSLRRSIASATAPPHSPNTTSGTRLAMPSSPTQMAATPTWETAWPDQIRRYAGTASGRVSTR